MKFYMNKGDDNHDEYVEKVNQGKYPEDCSVPLNEPFVNENGYIQNLILSPVTSVACIESFADTIRANHYHKTDWHYSYVISGKIVYYERPVGETEIPDPRIFGPNQMFFSPPMVEHVMYFPEDTVFVTLAKNVRSHESHESDVIRVNFVTKEYIHDLIAKLNGKPKKSLSKRIKEWFK